MFSPGFPLTDTPIFYYDTRRLHPKLHFVGLNDLGVVHKMFKRRTRTWLIQAVSPGTDASALAQARPLLRRYRYHTVDVRVYTTSSSLAVMLVVPDARRLPARAQLPARTA